VLVFVSLQHLALTKAHLVRHVVLLLDEPAARMNERTREHKQ